MASQPPKLSQRISFSHLPTDNEALIPILATKYKALRLNGLKLSPSSFSSTYAVESAFSNSEWVLRLKRKGFETFICAASPEADGQTLVVDGPTADPADFSSISSPDTQWVAQLTLRGPLSYDDFALPPESGQEMQSAHDAAVEERWQILSLYVLPGYRGQSIAARICDEAFRWLEARARGAEAHKGAHIERLRLRAMMKPDNIASITLFGAKLGFTQTGRCLLAEALRANGESVPEAVAHEERNGLAERSGWIYTKIVPC